MAFPPSISSSSLSDREGAGEGDLPYAAVLAEHGIAAQGRRIAEGSTAAVHGSALIWCDREGGERPVPGTEELSGGTFSLALRWRFSCYLVEVFGGGWADTRVWDKRIGGIFCRIGRWDVHAVSSSTAQPDILLLRRDFSTFSTGLDLYAPRYTFCDQMYCFQSLFKCRIQNSIKSINQPPTPMKYVGSPYPAPKSIYTLHASNAGVYKSDH